MTMHSSTGKFVGDCETWKSYTECLTQHFTANDVKSVDKR